MLLDMNLDPSNCNNTYQGLYWGKEVGDTITTQETINGTPYNVEYKITAIDLCNVQTLEISSTMVGHDPVIQTISDAVYADEFIWNDQLQQWTEQPNPASYNPLNAQTSGAYEIGCAFGSLAVPFLWSGNLTSPLLTDNSVLTPMTVIPSSGFLTDYAAWAPYVPNAENFPLQIIPFQLHS